MDKNREDGRLEKLEQLEETAVREEEVLHETLEEIRHEIDELKHEHGHEPGHGHDHPFKIQVNHKPVTLTGHQHSGLEIKQAAMDAGVRIQLDFVLSEELSHGRSRIVGDEQRIHVEEGACFEAIPNDDHS